VCFLADRLPLLLRSLLVTEQPSAGCTFQSLSSGWDSDSVLARGDSTLVSRPLAERAWVVFPWLGGLGVRGTQAPGSSHLCVQSIHGADSPHSGRCCFSGATRSDVRAVASSRLRCFTELTGRLDRYSDLPSIPLAVVAGTLYALTGFSLLFLIFRFGQKWTLTWVD
jgi:hypothetical protein